MIRKTILAMTTFASIAGALAGSATASDTVNRLPPAPHPLPVPHLAPSASSQAASANPLEGKQLRYLIGSDKPGAGSKTR